MAKSLVELQSSLKERVAQALVVSFTQTKYTNLAGQDELLRRFKENLSGGLSAGTQFFKLKAGLDGLKTKISTYLEGLRNAKGNILQFSGVLLDTHAEIYANETLGITT